MNGKRFSEEVVLKLKEVLVGRVIYRRKATNAKRKGGVGHCLGEIRSVSSDGIVYLYNKDYKEHSKITLSELKEKSGAKYIISKTYI